MLERVLRHIQRDNLTAARKVADTIYTGVTNLENFPNRGRTGRIDGTRELLFPSLPYIVAYHLKPDAVENGRIYPGAQDWP
jgi:plasmid stabilization system protein ParE